MDNSKAPERGVLAIMVEHEANAMLAKEARAFMKDWNSGSRVARTQALLRLGDTIRAADEKLESLKREVPESEAEYERARQLRPLLGLEPLPEWDGVFPPAEGEGMLNVAAVLEEAKARIRQGVAKALGREKKDDA